MTTQDDDVLNPGDRLPQFRRSFETYKLVELFAELAPGEGYSYHQLSKVLNKPVMGSTPALQTAKRIVLREYGSVIDAVYGEGVRRLTDEEIIEASMRGTKLVSRRATSESEKLGVTDFSKLSDEQKRAYTTHQSILGAIAAISSPKGIATVKRNVIGEMRQLPIRETLDLFRDE